MLSLLVARGVHVGDSDQNSTVWVGVLSVAPEAFHRDRFLCPPRLIGHVHISPDSPAYAFSADWKEELNWTVKLPAQKEKG